MGGRAQTIKQALSEGWHLAWVRRKLGLKATPSRTELAELACERFGFHDARGRPQVASCRKALRDLEAEGYFSLPPPALEVASQWRARRLEEAVPEPLDVPASVDALIDLRVLLVDPGDEDAMRVWNELIIREHPQGDRRMAGRQLRYLVSSAHGWLGAVGFSASALQLEARDKWIGWDREQQQIHRDRVINLSRLLIRPSVECRNLASHVIGTCLGRVAGDFEGRYGYRPWLVETFVDREHHQGTCFRAANFRLIGQTKGRGRNDRRHEAAEGRKDIYVYPLEHDFRALMGVPAERASYLRPLALEDGQGAEEWAQQEFGAVQLGDKRFRDRLIKIAHDRSKKPDASYLEAVGGDRKAVKGYYYFVDSSRPEITPEAILAGHRERTIERMMAHETVLVVQDTSDLNFASRHHTEGLGPIGTNQTGAQSLGLRLHSSLALSAEGLPLGVLRSSCFAPEPYGEAGKQSRPIEEKKSFRWLEGHRDCVEISKMMPKTRILSVMDREADLFELFLDADPHRRRVGLLVRAKHNRCLVGEEQKLFELVKGSKSSVRVSTFLPRQRWKKAKQGKPEQGAMPGRTAELTVKWERVVIRASSSPLRSKGPVTLWAVHACEENPPRGAKKIEWFLLTTETIENADDAVRMVRFYTLRWRIEEWHRVLKTGCRVQEHQNETAERLKRVIAIDAVVAWRIQLMTLLGREVPDLPCEVFFNEWEVRVLEAIEADKGKRGLKPPFTLHQAIIIVAQQGGYLNRSNDPPPGSKCIWKGMIFLYGAAMGFRMATLQARGP